MIRSSRRGRQGSRTSKLKHHDHVTDLKKVDATSKAQKNNKSNSSLKFNDEADDTFYDYRANTKLRVGRIKGNNIDDERMMKSKGNYSYNQSNNDDEGENENDQNTNNMRELASRFQLDDQDEVHIVETDDDESINSDEAMGDFSSKKYEKTKDDEKPSKKRFVKNAVRFFDKKLEESGEEEEEDDDDNEDTDFKECEFIDASTMLDIGAESDNTFSESEKDENYDKIDQTSEDGDLEESSGDDDIDLDEEDESKLSQMAHLIQHLNASTSQKRKDGIELDLMHKPSKIAKKQKLLIDQIETRPENEVVISSTSGDGAGLSDQIKLEDLISNLPSTYDLQSLKKSLKPLASNNQSSKSGPLPAPLDPRNQQRIERVAAYELAKREIGKWDETSRANRGLIGKGYDGIHRFVAPDKKSNPTDNQPDVNRWNVHFKPSNSLESQVLRILQESRLSSRKIQEEESGILQEKGLTKEQIKARLSESRITKELLFRTERKAKRVAKIKSKTFRRIRKKERERKARENQDGELDLEMKQKLDEIDGGKRVKEEIERLETQRARERASLKHSSQGAWAKKVSVLKGLDGDAHAAIQERIKREELLKRKIEGKEAENGVSEESEGEDSEFDSDLDVAGIKEHALIQLAAVNMKETSQDPPAKGLMAMKFMQRAEAQKIKQVNEVEAALRQELLDNDDKDYDSDSENLASSAIRVQGNPGRLMFGSENPRKLKEAEIVNVDPEISEPKPIPTGSSSDLKSLSQGAFKNVSNFNPSGISNQSKKKGANSEDSEENPWLTSKLNELVSSRTKDSSILAAEKEKLKAEKRKRKNASVVNEAKEEARIEIDLETYLGNPKDGQFGLKALKMMETNNSSKVHDPIIRRGNTDSNRRTAIEQRELVSQAFADDGVVAQFEEEKQKEIRRDEPKKLDVTLPGWGDWGGKGAKKSRHSKKFYKRVEGIKPDQRLDSTLSNVIISEKKNFKKVLKYQTGSLPFPYTSSSQLEHKMRQSFGPEFNTKDQFRHLVRPDVLLYPGQIIEPVSEPKI
ncbi:Utp14 protein-domain-containing protein [Phakopsora pachyrhizi]|nr:Utp14 protein-domain-containing protein [Phakopsora pachyrhizi]